MESIQTKGLGVLIGWYTLDSQQGNPFGCSFSFFWYTNDELSNHSNQIHQRRKWTRENNKTTLHCHFRCNRTQRGHRKRMKEIWKEYARFNIKILIDQARTKKKKERLVFDLEILEIYQQINRETCQQDPNAIT